MVSIKTRRYAPQGDRGTHTKKDKKIVCIANAAIT